ncbi:type III polyketide synthase [bacterium]|nr:type III polyketide synthase [bacterium]
MTKVPNGAFLATVATAVPPFKADQKTAREFFAQHYEGKLKRRSLNILEKLLEHPSIEARHFALDDPARLIDEPRDDRVGRFTSWAVDLACEASLKALDQTGLGPGDIDALVINTCTGYLCPGLTSYVAERLGLGRHVPAFDLVGGGCAGALPGLMIAEGQLAARKGGAVLCVAVEICSATFHMGDDTSLLLSNVLFGDGAAAAVLWTEPVGLALVANATRHLPEERDSIRYVHRDGDMHNQLSTSLPRIMAPVVEETVTALVKETGISMDQVRHWALHGGGDSVINGVGSVLGLTEAQLEPTRRVLKRFGNMSSPSSLFVLKEILNDGIDEGDWIVLAAFGAGLTTHASVFRAAGNSPSRG